MYSTHRFAPRALFETHDRAKVRSVCRDGGCVPQTIGNVVKVLASVDSVTALHNTRNANRIRQFRDTRWKSFIHASRRCGAKSDAVESLAYFLCEAHISTLSISLILASFFITFVTSWYNVVIDRKIKNFCFNLALLFEFPIHVNTIKKF